MFERIASLITDLGYAGVAILMFLENIVPPIPSELIMPLAGFVASRGELDHGWVVLAGSLGSFAGAWAWFAAARRMGERRLRRFVDRHGKWVTLQSEDIDRATDWFRRHGAAAVFFGRLIPGVRTFISVPAGLSNMSAATFAVYTALGTLVWTGVLVWAGHVLQANYAAVKEYTGAVSTVVFTLLGLAILRRYWIQWRRI